jgi:RHS repeat-associated protein
LRIPLSTGREWDKETGLYYYRERYYDPMEGKFISKDPIGFKGGINLYAYVGQNPINYTDPFGLTMGKGNVPPMKPPNVIPQPDSDDLPNSPSCKCTNPVYHDSEYLACVYNNVFDTHLIDYLGTIGMMLVPSGVTNVVGAGTAIAMSTYIADLCKKKATHCN